MILSFILIAMFIAVLLTYLIPGVGYNLEEHHLRSVSGIIVLWREAGHFSVSAANLVLFALLHKTQPDIAWLVWALAQGILSFDTDTNHTMHIVFVVMFVGSLLYATVTKCMSDTQLWVHLYPLLGFSAMFVLALLGNLVSGRRYFSFQNLMELYWMLSFVYFFGKYDEFTE